MNRMIGQTIIFAVLLLIMWTIVILLVWQDGRETKKGTAMKDNDLISRSALLKKAEMRGHCLRPLVTAFHMCVDVKDIEKAPSVDAVEVVRKPVVGYEGYYEVDQFGRVFGVDRMVSVNDNGRVYDKPIAGKQMKQTMHDKGYKIVSLTKDGKTKLCFVHRIVAEAFIPNPDDLPMVNHKDEDKTNNFLENLEWCTALYNNTYGNAQKKRVKKIKGVPLSEEHKRKIGEGVRRSRGERRTDDATD